jgi:hypothetical protein
MNRVLVLVVLMAILPFHVSAISSASLATQPKLQTPIYRLRFSDVAPTQPLTPNHLNAVRSNAAPHIAEAPAHEWLKQQGWKKVWPRFGMGKNQPLVFAGPKEARYLRLDADDAHYIWTKPLEINPQQWPILEIMWGMERFAERAALDVHGRSDRPVAIIVSFGEKLASTTPLFPGVPRGLAFFWGETETVDQSYTCIQPRIGPEDVRMQCRYPHVHYIALRRNHAGSVHTEYVNLVESFQRYFPEYWKTHRRMPPVVGISFEAGTNKTHTFSQSRLYALTFMKTIPDQQVRTEEQR